MFSILKRIASASVALGICLLLLEPLSGGQAEKTTPKKSRWMEMGGAVDVYEIDQSQYSVFSSWLDTNGRTPIDYAVEQCRHHQIVIFGETHGDKDNLDFLNALVPEAYRKSGVTNLILEAVSVKQNGSIARLIEGETYDRNLALEIARSAAWGTWGYKEYWDLLETVWKLNRSLSPGQEHIKVIAMDADLDLQLDWLRAQKKLEDKTLLQRAIDQIPLIIARDAFMAGAIDSYVIRKGGKGIVLVGANHAYTHYAQPNVNEDGVLVKEWKRMARILYEDYGDRIFQIDLHRPDESPKIIYPEYKGGEPLFTDFLEGIMSLRDNKPVGFDVAGSPFANVRDSKEYRFHFQPKITFADCARGYIFLRPMAKTKFCTWISDFISDEMFKKGKAYFEGSFNRKFDNAKEVNDLFAQIFTGQPRR